MKKELYSEIENLIINWNNDGTKTAGSLTGTVTHRYVREIMRINCMKKLKNFLLNNLKTINSVL